MVLIPYTKKRQLKKHLIIWFLIVAYLNLNAPMPGSWLAKIIGGGIESLNYIFVFYSLSLYVFPRFWRSNPLYLFISIVICFLLFFLFTYINYFKIVPNIGGYVFYLKEPFSVLISDDIMFFFLFGSAGAASYLYRYSYLKLKVQTEKEKSILVKELNFLKNQFNSHITFNFLNYCYSKIHKHSPEATECIELYSDMLRHALQAKSDNKIALEEEILNIENLIRLQKILNSEQYIDYYLEGNANDKYITTRLLTNFIETAFINGVTYTSQNPLVVRLKIGRDELVLSISYSISKSNYKLSLNDHFRNSIQLLDLHYYGRYKFSLEDCNEIYTCLLKINL